MVIKHDKGVLKELCTNFRLLGDFRKKQVLLCKERTSGIMTSKEWCHMPFACAVLQLLLLYFHPQKTWNLTGHKIHDLWTIFIWKSVTWRIIMLNFKPHRHPHWIAHIKTACINLCGEVYSGVWPLHNDSSSQSSIFNHPSSYISLLHSLFSSWSRWH